MTAWMRLPVPVTTTTGPVRSTLLTSGRSVSSRSSIGADGRNRSFCSGSTRETMPAGVSIAMIRPRVDDGDPVGEALRLLHQVGDEQDGDAPVADRLDEVPRLAASLRVEAGRQLVEDGDLRLADEGERDREALLLAAGEVLVGRVALLGQPEVVDQRGRIRRVRVERGEQLERLGDRHAFGQLALLELDADDAPQPIAIAAGDRARGRGSCRRRACAGRRSTRRSSSCRRRSGPRMPKISPSSTENDTPSTAAWPP